MGQKQLEAKRTIIQEQLPTNKGANPRRNYKKKPVPILMKYKPIGNTMQVQRLWLLMIDKAEHSCIEEQKLRLKVYESPPIKTYILD